MIEFKVGDKIIKILDSERTPCEIWTRVVGYYRPTDSFNIGRAQEHKERKLYKEKLEIN